MASQNVVVSKNSIISIYSILKMSDHLFIKCPTSQDKKSILLRVARKIQFYQLLEIDNNVEDHPIFKHSLILVKELINYI